MRGAAMIWGVLFPVAAVELGLRAMIARRGRYYRYTPRWREALAHGSLDIPGIRATTRMEINADGERGDPPPAKSEAAYRVLVAGGSAAECYALDQRETWAAVVQRRLSEPAHLRQLATRRVHVGCVARAVLTAEETTLMLERILPRYRHLDAIVLMLGAADIVRWMEAGAPKVAPASDRSLDRLFEHHPRKAWGLRPRETALWRTLSQLNRRVRRPIVDTPGISGWLPKARAMRARAKRIDEIPDAASMLANYEHHLGELLALLKKSAPRVIVARQPWFGPNPTAEEEALFWNFGMGRPYKEHVSTYFTPKVVDALMAEIDARTARMADRLGVEQVDVNGQLEHSARTFYDELHFTPAGAEAVGDLVAKTLLRMPQ